MCNQQEKEKVIIVSQFRRICNAVKQASERNALISKRILDELRVLLSQASMNPSLLSELISEVDNSGLYKNIDRQRRRYNLDLPDQKIFSYGQMYEAVMLLREMSLLDKSIVENLCIALTSNSSEYRILKLIADNPSITNVEITSRVNLSKGRVSQIIKELSNTNRIVTVQVGKRNGYAITVNGIRLLEQLRLIEDVEDERDKIKKWNQQLSTKQIPVLPHLKKMDIINDDDLVFHDSTEYSGFIFGFLTEQEDDSAIMAKKKTFIEHFEKEYSYDNP